MMRIEPRCDLLQTAPIKRCKNDQRKRRTFRTVDPAGHLSLTLIEKKCIPTVGAAWRDRRAAPEPSTNKGHTLAHTAYRIPHSHTTSTYMFTLGRNRCHPHAHLCAQCSIEVPFLRSAAHLHGRCRAEANVRETGELSFPRRSIARRRSPLKVRRRLRELRCRARAHLPSTATPVQHHSPHAVGGQAVRRRLHNPRRQRLEPLVVPPLRRGYLVAPLVSQHVKGPCCGSCPGLRAHRIALFGL
eukprot:scaffold84601_cov61-Phaeocystis_antarctica.AAC.2